MKNILLVFSLVIFYSCHEPHSTTALTNNPRVQRPTSDYLYHLFTLDDAQKILGEPAHLKDSSSAASGVFAYRCAYIANAEDKTTGKTGIIYFMFEEYPDAGSAHQSYISIKKANEGHGIQPVSGVGEEAYFHGQSGTFNFALVRSAKKMFRLKVNKVTSNTSHEEFNKITRDIASRL